jgi:hypothetical protein
MYKSTKSNQPLTDYEQKTRNRLIAMYNFLIQAGIPQEQVVERIIRDLARGGSVITPAFVRRALNQ